MSLFLIVAGDFVTTGGMDRANHALAVYLARRGDEVHLVAHRVADDLLAFKNVVYHSVPKPAGSYLLGAPLMDRVGRYWAKRISARQGRVIVNGGNCAWRDVNWVHYVHRAWPPTSLVGNSPMRRLKANLDRRWSLSSEKAALPGARVVIANSWRTRCDLVERLGVPPDRVEVIYYGVDAEAFQPRSQSERDSARVEFDWPLDRCMVAFVGALSDRRKGFDILFEAWKEVCSDGEWDAELVVIGVGAELPAWRRQATDAGVGSQIRFLGFRRDVPRLLTACDLLVSPTRYEAYGLGVHEALCCGVPAMVSAAAGVAERYPRDLAELLLLPQDGNAMDLARRLRTLRKNLGQVRAQVADFSSLLRKDSWTAVARSVVSHIEKLPVAPRASPNA